jgi:uncharacterized protein (DUF885 family)
MSEAAAIFDALAAEFFSAWLRYHPDRAIAAGIPGYAHLLPAQSDDDLAALGGWLETLVVALEELDYQSLDKQRRIDLRLMFGAARVEHRELLERDWRHRDPLRFLPLEAIYHLTLQASENVREPLAGVLAALPEYLRLALAHLRPMAELVAPELVEAAIVEAERGRAYLRELARSLWLRRQCHGWSELESLIEAARKSLALFAAALRSEIRPRAAGSLSCGEAHLRFLLRHRHFVELDLAEVRVALTDALADCEEALVRVCEDMKLRPGAAWAHLHGHRVEPGARLDAYRYEIKRLQAFLHRTDVVSLPHAPLRVSERPPCPRPPRLIADYWPDLAAGYGTFFVTAAEAKDGRDEPQAVLRARCIDRTWGGAHLLAFATAGSPWRLPRQVNSADTFADAWGLYLREQLFSLGYLDEDDLLLALLQRTAAVRRAMLDLDLHAGIVGPASARERLAAIPGSKAVDLVTLSRSPGRALAAVLSWKALTKWRAEVSAREGAGYREWRFHDRVLAFGRIPVFLMLQATPEGGWDLGYTPTRTTLGFV